MLLAQPWSAPQQARFEALAEQSRRDQKAIEAADSQPFEVFRQEYVSPRRLGLFAGAAAQQVLHDEGAAQHQREPADQR